METPNIMNLPEVVITTDTELHHRIMQLNYLKEEQEQLIKHNAREIVHSMQPAAIIKRMMSKFSDSETAGDLKSVGLNLGKDFLITKLFGMKGSLKGFLTTLLVKKATDYVMNNHPDLILKGLEKLGDLLHKDIPEPTHN